MGPGRRRSRSPSTRGRLPWTGRGPATPSSRPLRRHGRGPCAVDEWAVGGCPSTSVACGITSMPAIVRAPGSTAHAALHQRPAPVMEFSRATRSRRPWMSNVRGNTVDVVAALNPTSGNSCAHDGVSQWRPRSRPRCVATTAPTGSRPGGAHRSGPADRAHHGATGHGAPDSPGGEAGHPAGPSCHGSAWAVGRDRDGPEPAGCCNGQCCAADRRRDPPPAGDVPPSDDAAAVRRAGKSHRPALPGRRRGPFNRLLPTHGDVADG
jgi:hypothetical protein